MSLKDLLEELEGYDDDVIHSRVDPVKGPMPWPGNKLKSIKNILQILPYRNGFAEVFGGSGVVTLNRKLSKFQVFNDANSGVTALFRVLRDPKKREEFCNFLDLTPHSRDEFCEFQRTWEQELDDVVKAAKFYYLVQMSFHGEMRVFGRSRSGVTAMTSKLRGRMDDLPMIGDKFLNIQIENLDWRVCLRDFDNEDMVWYLDPPYVDKNCYKDKMSRDDHKEMCERIFDLKGFVALSGYPNDIYDKYHWDHVYSWEIKDNLTNQMFNSDRENKFKGQSRGVATECLWVKE